MFETVNSATFRAFSESSSLFSDTQYRVEKSICIPPIARKLVTITRDMTVKFLEKILLNIDSTSYSALGSLTSKTYTQTPHTVLSVHWSDTPSSFSRRRLTCTSTVRLSP